MAEVGRHRLAPRAPRTVPWRSARCAERARRAARHARPRAAPPCRTRATVPTGSRAPPRRQARAALRSPRQRRRPTWRRALLEQSAQREQHVPLRLREEHRGRQTRGSGGGRPRVHTGPREDVAGDAATGRGSGSRRTGGCLHPRGRWRSVTRWPLTNEPLRERPSSISTQRSSTLTMLAWMRETSASHVERNVVRRFATDPDARLRAVEVEHLLLAGAVAVAQERQPAALLPDSLAEQRVGAAQLAASRPARCRASAADRGAPGRSLGQQRDGALEQVHRRRHVAARQRATAGAGQPAAPPAARARRPGRRRGPSSSRYR